MKYTTIYTVNDLMEINNIILHALCKILLKLDVKLTQQMLML